MDLRGRIYSLDPATGAIEPAYISPTVKTLMSDGTLADVPIDLGYRTMTVFREPDGTEALYVGSFVSTELPGRPPRLRARSTEYISLRFQDRSPTIRLIRRIVR